MGSGRDPDGGRNTVFVVERDGKAMELTLHPRLSGDDHIRRVGILQGYDLNVHSVEANSALAKAGLLAGDRIVSVNGGRPS